MNSLIYKYSLVLFILTFFTGPSANGQTDPDALPFIDEELHYDVKFNGLGTARATLHCSVIDSTSLQFSWALKSKSLYKMLFYVDNHYQTKTDTRFWLPVTVSKYVKQKNINIDMKTSYDRGALLAHTDHDQQWPIVPECMDLLSMLYHMRLQLTNQPDSLNYIIDIESHIWQVSGVVVNEKNNEYILDFTPALPVIERAWKTDLMSNRLSRNETKLTLLFGPGPQFRPQQILFENDNSSVEMRLKE